MEAIIHFFQMFFVYSLLAFLVIAAIVLVVAVIYLHDKAKLKEQISAEREALYLNASHEQRLNAIVEARRKKHRRQVTREEIIDALIMLQG